MIMSLPIQRRKLVNWVLPCRGQNPVLKAIFNALFTLAAPLLRWIKPFNSVSMLMRASSSNTGWYLDLVTFQATSVSNTMKFCQEADIIPTQGHNTNLLFFFFYSNLSSSVMWNCWGLTRRNTNKFLLKKKGRGNRGERGREGKKTKQNTKKQKKSNQTISLVKPTDW